MSEQNKAHNVLTRQVTDWTRERDRLDDLIAHATGAIHPEDSRAAPKGNHDFYAGVCAALSCVLAHDAGTLWREIVQSVGTDDLLQYAAHDEQDEWEVAGFSRYSNAELGRGKPKLRRAIADHSGAAAEMVASQSAEPAALPSEAEIAQEWATYSRQQRIGKPMVAAFVLRMLSRYAASPAATGAQGLTSQRVEEIANAYFHQDGTELGDMKTAIRVAVREALAQSAPAATAPSASPADAEEDAYVIDRLGKLLAEVAIALKGPDLAQHRHSYHDLPQVAQTLVLELDMYRTLYGKQAPADACASPETMVHYGGGETPISFEDCASPAAPTGDEAPAAPVMPDILLPLKIRNDRDMLTYLHQAFEREVHVCERCHDEDPARNTDSAYFLREYLAASPVPPAAPQSAAQDARDAEKIGEMVCGDIEAHIDGYEVGDYELIYGKQLDEINVNHPGKVFAIYIDRAAMGTEGPTK